MKRRKEGMNPSFDTSFKMIPQKQNIISKSKKQTNSAYDNSPIKGSSRKLSSKKVKFEPN